MRHSTVPGPLRGEQTLDTMLLEGGSGWEWVPLFPFLEEDPKGKITFLFSKRNKTKMSGPRGHSGESAAPNMPWSSLPAVQH